MSRTIKISNGDIAINAVTGQPKAISGIEKCSQDIAEILMVSLRQPDSSRSAAAFSRSYGNELATLMTPPFFSGVLGKPFVARKVQEAIIRLQDFQNADPNSTPDERINEITKLIVEQASTTDYIYFVAVTVESGATTPTASNLEAVQLDHQFPMGTGIDDRDRSE